MLPLAVEAQSVARNETARGTTVNTRAREDFDPLGVRLGAFRARAAAELGLGYDDNLFGTRRNRESDWFGTTRLEGGIESDWSTHAVGATASIDDRRYLDRSDQDWTDWSVGLFGRYDINADTNVEARYNHVVSHLETSSVDVQASGVSRPIQYAYDEAQLQAQTRFNRLGLLAIGNYRSYRFEDIDLGGPAQPPATDPGRFSRNDFDSVLGALGLSYALGPGRFVNVIGRVQDITYKESSQRGRDSVTYEGLVGFTYDFDGVWQARVAVGWRERNYEGNFRNLSGPAFEGEVIWQPTLLTTVTFAGRRTIEESIRGNAVSFTRTLGQVNVDHEYLRNVILGAELAVDRREYENPDQQATDGIGVLSARWLINRNLALIGSYQHVRRLSSSAGFEEYDRNLFQLRLRVAL
jgi:hypothetical protein